ALGGRSSPDLQCSGGLSPGPFCVEFACSPRVHKGFLIAVHCDITVWDMTSVMDTNRSIYVFTPERPRDLSARAPGPAPQEHYNIITRPQICLFKNFARQSIRGKIGRTH